MPTYRTHFVGDVSGNKQLFALHALSKNHAFVWAFFEINRKLVLLHAEKRPQQAANNTYLVLQNDLKSFLIKLGR